MSSVTGLKVKERRTDKTDFRLNDWYRENLPWDFPRTDIDFCVIDYDRAVPVAIIEHKHKLCPETTEELYRTANYKALKCLADGNALPFFEVRWRDDFAVFRVTAINSEARYILPQVTQNMLQAKYIQFIEELRELPRMILNSEQNDI